MILLEKFDSELKKIGYWEEKIILKEFAGKLFTIFSYVSGGGSDTK